MKLHIAFAAAAALTLAAAPSFAQAAPTPEWTGEGAIGAGVTTGNTSTTDVGIAAKLKHTGMKWSESGEFTDDYGKTDHVETKNRVAAAGQVDRLFTERLSGFGRVTYENDKFSGFENRYYVGVGIAYKVIDSDKTTWTLQGGPGYKVDEVRDQGVGPTFIAAHTEESFGANAGSRFKWKINDKVDLGDDTDVTYSDVSTQIKNSLGLTVALMDKLSARVSYDVIYDTDPPIGFKSTDTATKVSLVYKIG
jgi:putative salt-induced outer membrane protein